MDKTSQEINMQHNKRHFIDISWPITPSMTTYKNNKPCSFIYNKTFEQDGVRDSSLIINAHTGTHVDAPSHFIKDGRSIEQYPLDVFIGSCSVFDLTHLESAIQQEDLEHLPITAGNIVLLKTRNSLRSAEELFDSDFIYLSAQGAQYLAAKAVKAVGIDYLGIERQQPNHETHTILLSNFIPIIEGLRLAAVNAQVYTFYCFPLAIQGLEAAPARAILEEIK